MMTDPIADMLTRIRNAQKAQRESVSIPFSRVKEAIARKLQEAQLLSFVDVVGEGTKKSITLLLKYAPDGTGAIRSLERVSRPGRRVYRPYVALASVRSGFGMAILTTPKGILSDAQAREKKVGGEVLLRAW